MQKLSKPCHKKQPKAGPRLPIIHSRKRPAMSPLHTPERLSNPFTILETPEKLKEKAIEVLQALTSTLEGQAKTDAIHSKCYLFKALGLKPESPLPQPDFQGPTFQEHIQEAVQAAVQGQIQALTLNMETKLNNIMQMITTKPVPSPINLDISSPLSIPQPLPLKQTGWRATSVNATVNATGANAIPLPAPTTVSYAAAAAGQATRTWTKVVAKKKALTPVPATPISPRDRRLVITPSDPVSSIQAMEVRDKINKALELKGIKKPMVATVQKSTSGASIVITTTQDYTSKDLLQHQDVWSSLFAIKHIKKDEKWFKVIVHGIETDTFAGPNGMTLLQEEIETFNKGLALVTLPHWLSKPENRLGKKHSSVVIAFATQELATKAERSKLIIAGNSKHTAQYRLCKPTDQCTKCQGFGHFASRCQKSSSCELCAGNHWTKDHSCSICKSKPGETCIHTVIKCVNCQQPHRATSKTCEKYKLVEPYFKDPLDMEL